MQRADSDYFYEMQTQTGWGKTLSGFVEWCAPLPGWLTLDVGCGPGMLPAILAKAGCRAVGVDLDFKMLHPKTLHPGVAQADVFALPFASGTFDLLTASNLLFMIQFPEEAMLEMRRVIKPGGKLAMLNPSKNLSIVSAEEFAEQRGFAGIARDTLLNWAGRAERNHRWSEAETRELYRHAGLIYQAGIMKVGPEFALFSWGTA